MVEIEFFIGIAHISGIFIGFEALMGAIRKDEVDASKKGLVRSVVTVGLVSIVASLIPIGISYYGISEEILWFVCSLIFLGLEWAIMIFSIRNPEDRKMLKEQMREKPVLTTLFFLVLELPLQIPLILVLTGLFSTDIELALYVTALLFNLFQAAFVLGQLVYSKVSSTRKSKEEPSE
jgi:hypothetical protein